MCGLVGASLSMCNGYGRTSGPTYLLGGGGGGGGYLEKVQAELLSNMPFSKYRWHGLRRGGAATACYRAPVGAYFVWWVRCRRLATALVYVVDPSMVGPLCLPCPGAVVGGGGDHVWVWADIWGEVMYHGGSRIGLRAAKSAASASGASVGGEELAVLEHGLEAAAKLHWEGDIGSDSLSLSSASNEECGSPSSVAEQVGDVDSDGRVSTGGGGSGRRCKGGSSTPPPPNGNGSSPPRNPSWRPLASTVYHGESLVWALPHLSSGVGRQARRWVWLVLGGGANPPSGSVVLGTVQARVQRPLQVPLGSRRQNPVQITGARQGLGGNHLAEVVRSKPGRRIYGENATYPPIWAYSRTLPQGVELLV